MNVVKRKAKINEQTKAWNSASSGFQTNSRTVSPPANRLRLLECIRKNKKTFIKTLIVVICLFFAGVQKTCHCIRWIACIVVFIMCVQFLANLVNQSNTGRETYSAVTDSPLYVVKCSAAYFRKYIISHQVDVFMYLDVLKFQISSIMGKETVWNSHKLLLVNWNFPTRTTIFTVLDKKGPKIKPKNTTAIIQLAAVVGKQRIEGSKVKLGRLVGNHRKVTGT